MIQELKNLCKRLSCELIIKNNKDCVSSYLIKNINKEDILPHLNNIQDSHGRSVKLIENTSTKLTNMLPSIVETLLFSNSIYIETTDQLEFFSAVKGKWIKANNLNSLGSYRLKLSGQRYFIKMKGRKKIKKEIIEDDISSVTGESSLDELSVKSSDLKGLS